jgi:hypothetical protein
VSPGGPGPRQEVGDAESSSKHPPHVDVNAKGSPLQESTANPAEVPTMPANAHGSDHVASGEQPHSIDRASMYDRRPEEDKDSRPGS